MEKVEKHPVIYFFHYLVDMKKAMSTHRFNVARVERLELPTPGFGDQCSTN